jgi:hypothetical protein
LAEGAKGVGVLPFPCQGGHLQGVDLMKVALYQIYCVNASGRSARALYTVGGPG